MRHVSNPLATLVLLLASLALAGDRPSEGPGAPGPAWDGAAGRWEPLDAARRGGAWPGFEARFGPGWSIFVDQLNGAPSMLVGPGIDAGGPVRADDAGVARARAFLEELAGVLGVDDPSRFVVERAVSVRNPHQHEIVTINLKQTCGGLDVWHQAPGGAREHLAMAKFQFDGTLGRLVLLGSDAVPGLALPAGDAMSEAAAREVAVARLAAVAPIARTSTRSYVSMRGSRAFLAREVLAGASDPPAAWRLIFDAGTGALLEESDALRHVDVFGAVDMAVAEYPDSPTFFPRLTRDLRVALPTGAFAFTNVRGFFNIVHPGVDPTTVSGRMLGLRANVQNAAVPNLTFLAAAIPGFFAPISLQDLTEFGSAEMRGYHWTTETSAFVETHLGMPLNGMLAPLTVNVNVARNCDAHYDPVTRSVNFYRSGGGCYNTSYLDFIAHEFGHAFHHWFHAFPNPLAFSEGIGDHLSMYLTGTREVFRNARPGLPPPGRDYRFPFPFSGTTQYPCLGCEVHRGGEVWAGFTADVRDNLGNPFLAAALTIGQYAANPAHEPAAVAGVFVLDDLDGNLANGTPNCFAIAAAANAHSIPVPPGLGPCGQLPPPLSGVGLFRAPVFEPGLNSPFSDHSPALDATQKLAWFCSDRPGGVGGHDIWFSSRAAIAAPWAPPIDIANLNSPFDELYTWVSQDARTIWFSSNRPGGQGATDLWFSTRPAVPGVFAPPVPEVALNSPFLDEDPALSSDGLEIFFSSDRPGGFGPGAIWTAVRPAVGLPWGPPQLVLELDSLDYDHSPRLSSDGTRMIFASTRGLAGPGPSRFFLATRIQRGGLWTIRRELTEIATGGFDFNGDLTADGFSFWFSTRPLPGGPSDIRRADQLLPILGSISPVVRVGLSFLLILRRDPGNVGLIAFGTQISPIVLPPILGELELSPFVILTIGTHDANGIGTFLSPPIPPVLLGQQLHFQGVSGDAFGTYISNRFDLLVIP